MGCLVSIIFLLFIGAVANGNPIAIILLIVLIVWFISSIKKSIEEQRENKMHLQEKNRKFHEFMSNYNDWKKSFIDIEKKEKVMFIRSDDNKNFDFIENAIYIMYKNENKVKFIIDSPNLNNFEKIKLKVIEIDLDDIQFYKNKGEKVYENKITGGGKTSIEGAIVGGIIAGGAGAIVGSNKDQKEVNSKLIIHDNRETVLNLNYNNEKINLIFSYDSYESFYDLVPDKDFEILKKIKEKNIINENLYDNDIIYRLKIINDLKNQNIISEEEFDLKKSEILKKI